MLVRGLSRATVIDTACQLFAERGYRGASMKDIAEILGVRAPSLYNHVLSKQDILFAIMDKAMDRALDAQEEALAGVGEHLVACHMTVPKSGHTKAPVLQ